MGVSRPTEMTIRDLLQEKLRKKGVTVVPELYDYGNYRKIHRHGVSKAI